MWCSKTLTDQNSEKLMLYQESGNWVSNSVVGDGNVELFNWIASADPIRFLSISAVCDGSINWPVGVWLIRNGLYSLAN